VATGITSLQLKSGSSELLEQAFRAEELVCGPGASLNWLARTNCMGNHGAWQCGHALSILAGDEAETPGRPVVKAPHGHHDPARAAKTAEALAHPFQAPGSAVAIIGSQRGEQCERMGGQPRFKTDLH